MEGMKMEKWRKKGDTRADVRTRMEKGTGEENWMKVNTWHLESGEKEMKLYMRRHRRVYRALSGFSQVRSGNKWSLETGTCFCISVDFPTSIVPPLVPLPLHTTVCLRFFILPFSRFNMVSRPYSSNAPIFPRVQAALPPHSFLYFLTYLYRLHFSPSLGGKATLQQPD